MNITTYWVGIFAGPGTVFCDNASYVFMFLSIATSNLVATSLARKVCIWVLLILNLDRIGMMKCEVYFIQLSGAG